MSLSAALTLPRSATTAWWLTAWLRGDEATDEVVGILDHLYDRTGWALEVLARVRADAPSGAGLALPAPGDPVGLGGPPELNTAALEAGEAVIAGSIALVPDDGGVSPLRILPALRRAVPDLGEASRALRRSFLDSADGLARLEVARWRPEVADLLIDLRETPDVDAPAGVPDEAVDLAARGLLALRVARLALEDDGGAVSATQIDQRSTLLRPLERVGRHALVAACSPEAWPGRTARVVRDNL